MELERPTVSSLDDLVDLWVDLAAGQRAFGSHLLAEGNREAIRDALSRRIVAGGCLVARDPDPVGFVTFYPESQAYGQDRERGVVENLYVVPARRGEGIGTELLRAAETALAEGGADAVALEVLADNDAARSFYAERGYDAHRIEMERPVERETDTNEGG
ncbi:GNAT family N-acetyltransferase [Halosegnis marinus]|uniref:GNAT family N-acetyltransferase n=1 Tax=Halosegnis marinus TaxID=3034023 RepID=A0ABD5ZS68_9EURY|nr:GNAT family N-acetyltransferase [Halosegnis sp. DT85]